MHLAPRVPVDGDSFAAHLHDFALTGPNVSSIAFGDPDAVSHEVRGFLYAFLIEALGDEWCLSVES